MGLKKLTARHKEVVRRLVVGETPQQVATDLKMSVVTVQALQRDPLFMGELEEVSAALTRKMMDTRSTNEVLKVAAHKAAMVCAEASGDGMVGGTGIPPDLQLKAAWDVLDRTGYSGTKKSVVGVVTNPADLIIAAYNQRHGGGDEKEISSDDCIDVSVSSVDE